MDISIPFESGKFNYRVAGIVVHDRRVLAMRDNGFSYFYLPGGRVRLHELSESALAREFQEEMQLAIEVNGLVCVSENFFHDTLSGLAYHEIALYYNASLPLEFVSQSATSFSRLENSNPQEFKWIPIDSDEVFQIKPRFVVELLRSTQDGVRHVINSEV